MTWRIIKRRLQVFNSVTCVDLAIHRARDASHLRRQAVLSRLCKLRLTCRRPHAIIPLLAAAPHLATLEVEVKAETWRDDSQFRRRLALALEKCRSGVEVALIMSDQSRSHSNYTEFEGIDSTPILRLISYDGIFLSGLPAGQVQLACFTRLQCLEIVFVLTDEQMEAVGALTRLTRLMLEVEGSLGTSQLTPLSQLTALQELRVAQCVDGHGTGEYEPFSVRDFRPVVTPLVHLREVTLRYFCDDGENDVADVDSLLLALPAVTCLLFENTIGMASWRLGGFHSNGFAKLRKLSLFLEGDLKDVAQLATVLTKLEALTFVGDCQSLLSNLPRMPCLTELKAERVDENVILPYVSGTVLARLQGLQQLRLHRALDVKQWSEDVKSIAMLTDLRVLHVYDHIFFEAPSGWPVTTEDLMPLTALKQLRNLELDAVLASDADVNKFLRAMKAIRYERGFSYFVVPSYNHSRLTFNL
jgi:hypothetical protein